MLRRAALLAIVFAAGCSGGAFPVLDPGEDGGAGSDAASRSDASDAGAAGKDSGGDSGKASGGGSDGGHPGGDAGSVADGSTSTVDSGKSSAKDSGSGPVVDSGGPVEAGDPLAAARTECVQIINGYRATLNVAPLTESFAEEPCVDGQAQADYAANTAHSAFGKCSEWAQDECPGWQGPPSAIDTSCLAAMWAEGPPPQGQDNHWLNMSNGSYTKVACGFYQTPTGDWWATQDFW